MSQSKKVSIQEVCDSIDPVTGVLGTIKGYILTPSPLNDANDQSISFCSDTTDNAKERIRDSRASVIVCYDRLKFTKEDYKDKTLILVPDPRLAFVQVLRRYFEEKLSFGIHPTAVIDAEAKIHPNTYIGPHSYVGRCEIGEGTVVHGNVYIYSKVKIGRNVIINAGTVIGPEGILTTWRERIPHIGGVVIEDDVQIGSNVSIMRGILTDTTISEGTAIGHLCSIGHQTVVGKYCLIVTHSVIAGSCQIGDFSQVSMAACIREKIHIGKNAVVGMGAVVTKNVGERWIVLGVPAKKVGEVRQEGRLPLAD